MQFGPNGVQMVNTVSKKIGNARITERETVIFKNVKGANSENSSQRASMAVNGILGLLGLPSSGQRSPQRSSAQKALMLRHSPDPSLEEPN